MMKKLIPILLLLVANIATAQNAVNKYHYVIVPSKFSFLQEKDQYRLNTLTKLLLEKYGFIAYLDTDSMPDAVFESNCTKLYASVEDVGSFIMTKLVVVLKDCKGTILYQTAEGKSKEKEFKIVYNEALRAAFQSFDQLKYKYEPQMDSENAVEKQVSPQETVVLNENIDKESLYAQPIPNGFQLVDQAQKAIFKMLKTSNPALFIGIKGTITGVITSKENQWYFEYYDKEILKSEPIKIKF